MNYAVFVEQPLALHGSAKMGELALGGFYHGLLPERQSHGHVATLLEGSSLTI